MQAFPNVRPVSPLEIPLQANDLNRRFVLRDPAELATEELLVTLPALYLIELADGTRSKSTITTEFQRLTGGELPLNLLDSLLDRLDQNYLLDNKRSRARLSELNPRPYRLSGGIYPSDPTQAHSYFEHLTLADKPIAFPAPLQASILPHIDFQRGKPAYQAGYAHLRAALNESRDPLTIVILGISHAFSRTPFILTRKDFSTPYGVLKTNQALIERLTQNLPFDPFLDEFNHITEHSIELHAVLLDHLTRSKRDLSIVAILCGSFHEAILGNFSPQEIPGVPEFLKNLHDLHHDLPDVHFLASVDLAHMGLNFQQDAMNAERLSQLEKDDAKTLEYLTQGDAEGFFRSLQVDRGIRNYCGTPAIYSMLRVFPKPFRLECYRQCTDADLTSTVTVCSAVLEST